MKHKNLLKALVTTGVFTLFLSALVVLKPETASASPAKMYNGGSRKVYAGKTLTIKPKRKPVKHGSNISYSISIVSGQEYEGDHEVVEYNESAKTFSIYFSESLRKKTYEFDVYVGSYTYPNNVTLPAYESYKITVLPGKITPVGRAEVTKVNRKIARNGKQAVIRFKKVKDADGYQIQYSQDKTMKGAKTKNIEERIIDVPLIWHGVGHAITVKNLDPSEKLYVKVRAYKIVDQRTVYGETIKIRGFTCDKLFGKKFYGKWSKKFKALPVRQG